MKGGLATVPMNGIYVACEVGTAGMRHLVKASYVESYVES